MVQVAEELLVIDLGLRFAMFGLECALGVPLSPPEVERVFRDAAEDQVSAKEYVFHRSRALEVSGRVDEYEEGEIRLRVVGRRGVQEILRRVVEGAEYQVARIRASQEWEGSA